MQRENNGSTLKRVKGWIFDLYPSARGQMTVWVICKNGERLCLVDKFKPKIYVSGTEQHLERLAGQLCLSEDVESVDATSGNVKLSNASKSSILEVVLEDCRKIPLVTRRILEAGRYVQFQVHNCDLEHTQAYLYERNIFPLALTEVEIEKQKLQFHLHDAVESVRYSTPPLRIMKVDVAVAHRNKVASFNDPLDEIWVSTGDSREKHFNSGDEKEKLRRFLNEVLVVDPDILLTNGGDTHTLPYLARRASAHGISQEFVLSRENIPLLTDQKQGTSFFSYGRTYYRAPTRRLYGRVHVDVKNIFIKESGLDGVFEVARTCRVPLHRASRSSIGSSMTSLQFHQAVQDRVLIPRNKDLPESFKSAYELLVGDRGGFVYEPIVGVHDEVGEVDFSSMYPTLMAQKNISAETVLCNCCPDSQLRVSELNYNICEKHSGIVPKTLKLTIEKRLQYKRLKKEAGTPELKGTYERRQAALKWILVTCFGYLGYRNSKFGTVDGHIGVCAFGRDVFLKTAHLAEKRGFNVIHGIVDALWLKKEGAQTREFTDFCDEVTEEYRVPLNFVGRYRWIVFLPSKVHPNVSVLNRYYGVKEDGEIKVRGIEVRRRDTPKILHDAQLEMIKVLATAGNAEAFRQKIPDALDVVKKYRKRILEREVPTQDLVVSKRLSKDSEAYHAYVSQRIAAKQLRRAGIEAPAGRTVRFIYTDVANRRYERRVRAEALIETGTNADVKKYVLLLYSAAFDILNPFGYSVEKIRDIVTGYRRTELSRFCHVSASAV
jgi:DNA polymerase elongation subunit (family B)